MSTAEKVLGVLALLVSLTAVVPYYMGSAMPNAATGEVYEINTHGHLHYVTRAIWMWQYTPFVVIPAAALLAFVLRRTAHKK